MEDEEHPVAAILRMIADKMVLMIINAVVSMFCH